jgi:hypothetical protein
MAPELRDLDRSYVLPSTTPLSPGKIKKAPPKLTNFTYTEFDQIDRNA